LLYSPVSIDCIEFGKEAVINLSYRGSYRLNLLNMVVVFAIIGKSEPLYEAEIVPAGPGEEELAYLHQFILHASLDMVQSAMWSNNAT
jgi:Sedlin, N-terminal conserved region